MFSDVSSHPQVFSMNMEVFLEFGAAVEAAAGLLHEHGGVSRRSKPAGDPLKSSP